MKLLLILYFLNVTLNEAAEAKVRLSISPEIQKKFKQLATSAKEEKRIEATDVLAMSPTNVAPDVVVHVLSALLKDRSRHVRLAAARTAAGVMFDVSFFADDTSEIEKVLREMSSDDKILSEKPVFWNSAGPPEKIAIQAAAALTSIYSRTKGPIAFKRYKRHYYSLGEVFTRRRGAFDEYFALQMISLSKNSVSESEALLLLENIIGHDIENASIIVLAVGAVEDLIMKSRLTNQMRDSFLRVVGLARKFRSHSEYDVRSAVSQMGRILEQRIEEEEARKQ